MWGGALGVLVGAGRVEPLPCEWIEGLVDEAFLLEDASLALCAQHLPERSAKASAHHTRFHPQAIRAMLAT